VRKDNEHWDWATYVLLVAVIAYWAVRVLPVLLAN